MKNNRSFLNGVLLSSFLLLLFTLSITENIFQKTFNGVFQQAAIVTSLKNKENIYNISPSKDFPGTFKFNYVFEKTKPSSKEKNFDLSIQLFDETKAGEFIDFGPIRDTWGYPVRENAFMKQESKNTKKQSFNLFNIKEVQAYDEASTGLYNCRANTQVTGYFKAYFEDVVLDNNVGFDDPTFGDGRREEACQVLEDISELLILDTTTVKPDIIFMRSDTAMPPGALAAASSYSGYYATGADNGSLHKHIISRQDPTPSPGNFDAFIMTNFNGINWNVDSTLNQNTYDFYTVMYHEALHTLGFRGLLPAVVPQTGVEHRHGTFDYHTYKDESLQDRFITAITNLLNVPVGAPSPWFTTNQVVYRGVKNIFGATPDGIVPIYSPSGWQQGSSLSHFDMNRADGEIYVMHPLIGTNTERSIHEDEKDALCHLGYQVADLCQENTPSANDDFIFLNGNNSTCINPLTNDMPNDFESSNAFKMFTMTGLVTNPGDEITYYPYSDCSGPSQLTSDNAKSFILNTDAEQTSRMFEYVVKNGGRLSLPSKITTVPECGTLEDSSYEYICNGTFDIAVPAVLPSSLGGYSQIACSSWDVPNTGMGVQGSYVLNTCQFSGTPDVIHADVSLGPASDTSPAPLNTNFPYIRSASGREVPLMKLREPLISGQEYTLSFDVARGTGLHSTNIKFALINGQEVGPTAVGFPTVPEEGQLIFNSSPNLANWRWESFEQNFTPNENFDSIIFFAPSQALSTSGQNFVLFDNISIKPTYLIDTSLNTISGNIYQDFNQSGSQNVSFEPGLSGVQVGLFQTGSTTPIQIVTTQDLPNLGKYEFTNLSDGEYYVGLIGENLYESVTEPEISIDSFAQYNHMYAINVNSNQAIQNQNFGVLLNSNGLIAGCTDKDAPNWNSQATVDDGSCEGDAIIKGVLFQDSNGNSQKEANESLIPNRQVGLYIPNQATPTQVSTTDTMGIYSFTDVFVGDRYVALVDESNYLAITTPSENPGLVENHNHIHSIDVEQDTDVYYADFGVVNSGPLADITIRKYFTDSQISLIDRIITWRVDITNSGPHNATSININDTIPTGLTLLESSVVGNVAYTVNNGTIYVPSLPVGQTTSVIFKVRVPSNTCGIKINTATLLSLDQIDIHTENNQSSSSKNFGLCTKPVIQPPSVKFSR